MKRALIKPGQQLPQPADALSFALDMVSAMAEAGMVSAPVAPTPAMLAAGAEAGAVSLEITERIYHAMLAAV